MIPKYIIEKDIKKENPIEIQLEVPDYTIEYEEWMQKKQREQTITNNDTVIVIDIY